MQFSMRSMPSSSVLVSSTPQANSILTTTAAPAVASEAVVQGRANTRLDDTNTQNK